MAGRFPLLTDEHTPTALIKALRDRGWDVLFDVRVDTGTGRDVLQLAAEVYAGLSAKDIEEIEATSRRRPPRDSSR